MNFTLQSNLVVYNFKFTEVSNYLFTSLLHNLNRFAAFFLLDNHIY